MTKKHLVCPHHPEKELAILGESERENAKGELTETTKYHCTVQGCRYTFTVSKTEGSAETTD